MDFGGLGGGMGAAQADANVDLMAWYVASLRAPAGLAARKDCSVGY